MADRTVKSVAGLVATFGITVKDKDKEVPAEFRFCKDWQSFKSFVQGLNDKAPEGEESEMEKCYLLALRSADLAARAAARESVAAESTVVRRDGREIDIMKLKIENAVGAINAAYAEVAMLGVEPGRGFGPFSTSRRKLLEAGKVTEVNGLLTVRK